MINLEPLKTAVPYSVYLKLQHVKELKSVSRAAHFLAQLDHESNGYKAKFENLGYSKDGLLRTFPSRFTPDEAEQYSHKPECIANHVYANRMGNGDEKSGDGWKFRGRGFIQVTGHDNYKAFSKYCGDVEIMTNPDILAVKYPVESAVWYFTARGIWEICDEGYGESVVKSVTKRINPAYLGLEQRVLKFKKYWKLLNEQYTN